VFLRRGWRALPDLQCPYRRHVAANAGRLQDRGRQGWLAALSWSTPFFEPIELPNGKQLVTLKDAATYITSLPKRESDLPEWQTAIEVLLLCSRGGDTMMARIGVLKALHRDRVREFKSDRKETHWGKRKLKRDE
jgi:hypothetical protein